MKLDPLFAQHVHTDSYHVFLTPHDAEHHLAVTARAGQGFTVAAAMTALRSEREADRRTWAGRSVGGWWRSGTTSRASGYRSGRCRRRVHDAGTARARTDGARCTTAARAAAAPGAARAARTTIAGTQRSRERPPPRIYQQTAPAPEAYAYGARGTHSAYDGSHHGGVRVSRRCRLNPRLANFISISPCPAHQDAVNAPPNFDENGRTPYTTL